MFRTQKLMYFSIFLCLVPYTLSVHLAFTAATNNDGLLYPISGATRDMRRLDGSWKLRFAKEFDPDEGFRESWYSRPLDQNASVFAVQVPDNFPETILDSALFQRVGTKKRVRYIYTNRYSHVRYSEFPLYYSTDGKKAAPDFHPGWFWYETEFVLPTEWKQKRIFLRVGAAHYYSIVYVNGQRVTEHEGGSIPFVTELTTAIMSPSHLVFEDGKNRLTIAMNSTLSSETLPQGHVEVRKEQCAGTCFHSYQRGINRDYWDYAGIHDSVIIYATPLTFIEDINVTTSHYEGGIGFVNYSVRSIRQVSTNTSGDEGKKTTMEGDSCSPGTRQFLVELLDKDGQVVASNNTGGNTGVLTVHQPHLWWPYTMVPENQVGYLYTLKIKLTDLKTFEEDIYTLDVGIRTVRLSENRFYINERPFYFRGILQKEFQKRMDHGNFARLSLWDLNRHMGANAMRGLYRPLSEEVVRKAGRKGVAVISEAPAVELRNFDALLLNRHKEILRQLIQRDKNNPAVVLFSLANLVEDFEPEVMAKSSKYFRKLIEFGRQLDPQKRPFAAVVRAQNIRNSSVVRQVDVVGLSWHKTTVVERQLVELNQTKIVEEIIEWSKEREGDRKPLLFVAEYGVHPTQLWSGLCLFDTPYERNVLDEFHSNFDKLLSMRDEVPLVGEINWSCDNDRIAVFTHFNDVYYRRRIQERYKNQSLAIASDDY